jgi:integrase
LREGPVKITKAVLEAAWRRRERNCRIVIPDAVCRGLALVVNAGSMAWVYGYKPRGTDPVTGKRFSSRAITIGNPETHSPDDARAAPSLHKGHNKSGRDPAAERKAKIATAAQQRGRTLDRLLDEYAKALPKRPKLRGTGMLSSRQVAADLAHARAAVASMAAGDRPASDVNSADLRAMLRQCSDRAATVRHRFGALSRFFDWALDEGIVPANPCLNLAKARRPKAVAARVDYLTVPQLAQLWEAAEALEPVSQDLARFIIAMPCRRGEAAAMEWSHVDLATCTWSQPGRLTKNRDAHRLFLHPLALSLLQARFESAGRPVAGLVFPAPRSGKIIDTFSDIKEMLVRAAPALPSWRFHDFRRSFVTALGEAGVNGTIADGILNHRQSATRGGVLGVYRRAQRWPEQVGAMTAWGRILADSIIGTVSEAENVLPLTRERR